MSFKEEFERVQAAGAEANAEQARKRKQQAEAKRKQRAGGVSAAQQETETAAARSGDDAEIARLAALPPVTYDRERKEAAEALGVRVSLLDRMVSEARNLLEREKEADTQIAKINATHALVLAGNKAAVMKFEEKTKFRLLQVGAFKQWFSNQLIPVGKKIISLGEYWLSHPERRQYQGIEFAPPGSRRSFRLLQSLSGFCCRTPAGRLLEVSGAREGQRRPRRR